jgi:hypothetical protein
MTLPLASARKAIPAYIILRMPPRNSALFTPNPIPRLLVGLRLDGAAAFTRFAHFRSATMLPNDFACPAAHTLGRAVVLGGFAALSGLIASLAQLPRNPRKLRSPSCVIEHVAR